MYDQPDDTERGREDDLTRQRRKRDARLLDQSVRDFPDLSVAQVIDEVMAAIEESDGDVDVQLFLADRGHGWQTIELVQAYLRRGARSHPSQMVIGGDDPMTSQDHQRARADVVPFRPRVTD